MTGQNKNDFINKLVNECKPVSSPKPFKLFFIWFVAAAFTILATLLTLGTRHDFLQMTQDYGFCGSIMVLALGAILSAWTSIKISIPGEKSSQPLKFLLLFIPIILAIGVSAAWFTNSHDESYWLGMSHGVLCGMADFFIAIIPLIILTLITASLAPLHPFVTSVFVALSSLFTSGIAMQLHCSSSQACHMAFWHYLPIFAGSFLIALPAQLILGRWKKH